MKSLLFKQLSLELQYLFGMIQPDCSTPPGKVVSQINWSRLEALALYHGVSALVYYQIKTHSLVVPDEFRKNLKRTYLTAAARYLIVRQAFEDLLQEAQVNDLPLCLKGIYFSHHYYPEPTLRPLSDLDFLVPKNKILSLCQRLIESKKFISDKPITNLPHHYQIYLKHVKTGVLCEMHWAIDEGGRHPKANRDFIHNSKKMIIDGIPIRVLSPEDDLLYMAVHFISHSLTPRLIWLADIIWALKKYGMDWQDVKQHAQRYHLLKPYLAIEAFLNIAVNKPVVTKNLWLSSFYFPRVLQGMDSISVGKQRAFFTRLFTTETLLDKIKLLWFYFIFFGLKAIGSKRIHP